MSPSPRGWRDGLEVKSSLGDGEAAVERPVCRAGALTANLAHAHRLWLLQAAWFPILFSISFRDWGGKKEAEKCHSSVRS